MGGHRSSRPPMSKPRKSVLGHGSVQEQILGSDLSILLLSLALFLSLSLSFPLTLSLSLAPSLSHSLSLSLLPRGSTITCCWILRGIFSLTLSFYTAAMLYHSQDLFLFYDLVITRDNKNIFSIKRFIFSEHALLFDESCRYTSVRYRETTSSKSSLGLIYLFSFFS